MAPTKRGLRLYVLRERSWPHHCQRPIEVTPNLYSISTTVLSLSRTFNITTSIPPSSQRMNASTEAPDSLPTLGWVENGDFIPLPNIVLQSFMDCPVRSWDDDFTCEDRTRLQNLKCMLPSGRLLPGQVPIVKEFDPHWTQDWRASLWADGRRCFRVEHMSEREGLLQVYDIDPTPAPTYVPQPARVLNPNVTDIQYGGWTDNTNLFVLRSGTEAAAVNINMCTLEELDGVVYNIHARTTATTRGMARGVPHSTTKDVRMYVWNCRGMARASFRPDLFTMTSTTDAAVVVLTDTRATGRHARQLLKQATKMNYFYTEPQGFVGGVAVLWDSLRVFVTGITVEPMHASFVAKGLA